MENWIDNCNTSSGIDRLCGRGPYTGRRWCKGKSGETQTWSTSIRRFLEGLDNVGCAIEFTICRTCWQYKFRGPSSNSCVTSIQWKLQIECFKACLWDRNEVQSAWGPSQHVNYGGLISMNSTRIGRTMTIFEAGLDFGTEIWIGCWMSKTGLLECLMSNICFPPFYIQMNHRFCIIMRHERRTFIWAIVYSYSSVKEMQRYWQLVVLTSRTNPASTAAAIYPLYLCTPAFW